MEEEAVAAELPTAWSEVTGNPPPSNMASPFPEVGGLEPLTLQGHVPTLPLTVAKELPRECWHCLSIYELFSV